MKRLGLTLAICLIATPVFAQLKKPAITGDVVKDTQTNFGIGQGPIAQNIKADLLNALAKPFNDLASFITSDADAAISLSTQIPELQDGHGQKCWVGMGILAKVLKAHPISVSLKAMSDIEGLRLASIAANKLCTNPDCSQVFAELSAQAQAVSPIPLPIPSLHDLCSKIPQIALDAPISIPTVTPIIPPAVNP